MSTTLRSAVRSWQTTLAAVGVILAELGKLLQGNYEDFNIEAVILAAGLVFARDSNKSSEDVGTKP